MKENLFQKTEKTLYDYKNLDLRIANIDLEIQILINDVSCAGVSYEFKGGPTNSFSSVVENEVVKRDEYLSEHIDTLKKKKLRTIALKQKITNALMMLNDEQYRLVELRYFDTKKKRKTWLEIGMMLSIDKDTCCRMKNKVVNKLKDEIFDQY
ncbi:xanthine dehydrogenase [Clostridium botulinum]|uniref:xanthine dehydrogenase n=1 Tax=Clostridium botulinum TaxID=1491 RepID=UPI0014008043|nr:xanthine dehydrogenase [Clostridium botulinum]MBY6918142.1 xanthine dehydrogenase [Clostridium botulinum]NFQ39403.1 xanthine dehydrogenase [Clostridium botulinum]